MNWTRTAIEKNRVTIVALIVLVFSGINAYRTMPRAEDPGFTIRVALVVTYFPGASPRRVEELVTDRIEKVVGFPIPRYKLDLAPSRPNRPRRRTGRGRRR